MSLPKSTRVLNAEGDTLNGDIATLVPVMPSVKYENERQYGSSECIDADKALGTPVVSEPAYFLGCLLMLGSSISIATMSMIVHYAQKELGVSAYGALFIRGLIQSSLAAGYIGWNGKARESFAEASFVKKTLLALRGFTGAVSYGLYYVALGMLPLSLAVTVYFLGPIFVLFFANVFLKEKICAMDYMAASLSFSGLLLVARPDRAIGQVDGSRMEQLVGIMIALLSSMMGASGFTLQRVFGKSMHVMFTVLSLGFFAVLISVVLGGAMCVLGMETSTFGLLCLSGVFAFSGQFMSNKSVQVAPAAPLVLIRNLDIPVVYLMGVFVLHESLPLDVLLGSCLIVSGSIMVGVQKIIKENRIQLN